MNAAIGHDARGNTTSVDAAGYTYSAENLLLTGPSSASLVYDPLARLYQVGQSATTRFLYDGQEMVGEYDGSDMLRRRYVFGPGSDEALVWYEGAGTGDRRWLHADERGSVIAVSNGAGTTLATNAYDEYGTPALNNVGRFGYTGQAWLPELGLWYYKARAYAPKLGRFMQTDPIGYNDGLNPYNYVGSDPVNLTDPSGTLQIISYCTGGYSYSSWEFVDGLFTSVPTVVAQVCSYSSYDDGSASRNGSYSGGGGGGGGPAPAPGAAPATPPQSGRNGCNDPISGKPRTGLDAVEDFLQTSADGASTAADSIALFGLANALLGDEIGATAASAVAAVTDKAALGLGGIKGIVQVSRGNLSGAIRTLVRASISNIASRAVERAGHTAVGVTNIAGKLYSQPVGSTTQNTVSSLVCGIGVKK